MQKPTFYSWLKSIRKHYRKEILFNVAIETMKILGLNLIKNTSTEKIIKYNRAAEDFIYIKT